MGTRGPSGHGSSWWARRLLVRRGEVCGSVAGRDRKWGQVMEVPITAVKEARCQEAISRQKAGGQFRLFLTMGTPE